MGTLTSLRGVIQAMVMAKGEGHALMMGHRSTVGCICGWRANVTQLQPEAEDDKAQLARLYAEHLTKAAARSVK